MAILDKIRTQGKFTIPAGETSDAIEFFDDIAVALITLSFPEGIGQARVQASTSLHDDLEAGTATWVDWPNGSVTILTQDWAHAPNAIRVINEGATSVLIEIRGNYSK